MEGRGKTQDSPLWWNTCRVKLKESGQLCRAESDLVTQSVCLCFFYLRP